MPDVIFSDGQKTYESVFPRFVKTEENEEQWIKFLKLLVKYIGNKDNRVNEEAGWIYEIIVLKARELNQIVKMGRMPNKNVIWCVKYKKKRDGVISVEYCKKKTGTSHGCRNDEKEESYISASGKVYFGVPRRDYKNTGVRSPPRPSSRRRSRSPGGDRHRSNKDQMEYPVYQGGYPVMMSSGYRFPSASFNTGYGGHPQVLQSGYYATQREQELQTELQILRAQLSAGYGPPPVPLNAHPEYIQVPPLSSDIQYPGSGRFFEDKKGTRL